VCAVMLTTMGATAQTSDTIALRGHLLTLRLYGRRRAPRVIVSSGDGRSMHLGPLVAETLAAGGYFVVGFDVKDYLESFVPLSEAVRVLDAAKDPKHLWVVTASDHRFSGNRFEFERRLFEAVAWVQANSPR
jgi:hypothetical protein